MSRPRYVPRQSNVLADREPHVAPRTHDFLGQLHAARRCTDHQHAAPLELVGIAISERRDGSDLRRQLLPQRRNRRPVARTARQHDRGTPPLAAIGDYAVAVGGSSHRTHMGVGLHGHPILARIPVDEADHLRHGHESIAIRAAIPITRQTALPVRSEQPQRIPALVPPRVRDFAALEHEVLDAAFRKAATDGEPRVTRADDDDVDGADSARLQYAVTPPPRRRWWGW